MIDNSFTPDKNLIVHTDLRVATERSVQCTQLEKKLFLYGFNIFYSEYDWVNGGHSKVDGVIFQPAHNAEWDTAECDTAECDTAECDTALERLP
jgi:hypothetical protein